MTTFTNFIDKAEFHSKLFRAAQGFSNDAFKKKFDTIDLLPVGISDGYQLINFIAHQQKWSETVRKLYIQNFFNAESYVKGSGIFSTYLLSKRILGASVGDIDDIKNDSRWTTPEDAKESIAKLLNGSIANLFFDVIDEIGIFGTFSVLHTSKSIPTLEIAGGHKFKVGIHNNFPVESRKFEESKIVLVDGAIVEISEIDYLLNDLSEAKVPCILIARSFSDDVLNTLLVNYRRKTLTVLPIAIDDNIENINIVGDIAVCSGAKFISPDSGERINSVRLNDCATINKVVVNHRQLMFDAKPEMEVHVNNRIKKIKEKIEFAAWNEEMSAEDIEVVFTKRIRAISGNSVRLWIPGSIEFVNHVRNNFKFGVEYISAFANTGKIKSPDVFDSSYFPEYIPTIILESAMNTSRDTHKSIIGIGGCIEISEDD
jgi:hypothetical protein